LLALPGYCLASDVSVRGYVRDSSSGELLPYANILIEGTSYGTATNNDGYFVFLRVPAGPCTLSVEYIGYKSLSLPLNAHIDMEPVDIELEPQSLVFDPVTVTAAGPETVEISDGIGEIKLSPKGLKVLPSIGEVDIFRSLQLLPGISAASDGSSGLYIRGGTPDQNLVLFDGMTIYNVDHFFGFISAFNAEAVKDVRVFKGGYPAKYGGRISSVVELTGKSGSYDKFMAGSNINLLSVNGVTQVPIAGKGAWLLSFRRSHTDIIQSGLYDRIFNSISGRNTSDGTTTQGTFQGSAGPGGRGGFLRGPAAQNQTFIPEFYYYDLNTKLTYSLTPNNILSFSFYNGQDNLDESQSFGNLQFRPPNASSGDSTASASTRDITEWGNLGASLKWSRLWSDRIYSTFLLAYSNYFSRSESGFGTGGEARNQIQRAFSSAEDNEVRDFSLRLDTEWQAHPAHKFEFGLWRSQADVDLLFTANDSVNILDRNDRSVQTSGYLQDTWRLYQSLELTGGIRATQYDLTNKTYLEPRASFNFHLSDALALKGAWGKYNQFVNRITNENVLEGNRDFWLLADSQLEPTSAVHLIIGVTYDRDDYLFNIEAYDKDLDNVAEFSQRFRRGPDVQTDDLFFLGTGIARGLEFLVQKKYGRINGWVSYTLGKVESRFDVFNDGEPFPADQDRKHEFKAVGNYGLGNWQLSATWVYASGAPYTAPENQYSITLLDGTSRSFIHVGDKNSYRLPTYHRLDISLMRQFKTQHIEWDLGVSVFNLYNRANVWYREYVLDTSPILVRDITTLGFTPTVTFGIRFN
jgi:hypothetical protein